MAARFTSKIRSFIASSFTDSMSIAHVVQWTEGDIYTEGNIVRNGNYEYIAKTTGTAGSIPPTHISGTASDGSVQWIYVGQIEATKAFNKNLYLGLGKTTEWDNELIPLDPSGTDDEDNEILNNLITLIRLNQNNARIGCRHYKWQSGNIYSQYENHKDPVAIIGPKAYTHPFYVITDDNNIYKCINNNTNAASTVKPSNTGVAPFILSDGYVWKYIGSLDINSAFFKTNEFFPVSIRAFNDFSPQYNTQAGSIPKSISTFRVLKSVGTFPGDTTITLVGGTPTTPATAVVMKNPNNTLRQIIVSPSAQGAGYDLNSRVVALVQKSDAVGSGAVPGTITVESGVITNIAVDIAGSGYTGGAILIINDRDGIPTEDAVINVVISGGSNSVQQFQIVSGGSGYSNNIEAYVIPGNAGALGEAIFAPKDGHGHNVVIETGANAVIVNQRISSSGDYLLFGEPNALRQVSLLTDIVDKETSEYANELMYIGPSHPNYGDETLNEIHDNKGFILYINNIKKIVRTEGQEEDISIILTF